MIRSIIIACCFLVMTNCQIDPRIGYSSTTLYPKQYQSVWVPIFGNNTMERNLEFMLTDAVIKEIQSRTPYRIVGEHIADTQLTGTITSVELQTISRSRITGLDNEVLLNVVIDFEWLDLAGGERIVGKRHFSSSKLFIPSRPSSEPIEIGQFAVVQQLASDIVDLMQASW